MSVKEEEQRDSFDDDFPAGLKVLLVDDDPLCLKVIGQMLKCCKYEGIVMSAALLLQPADNCTRAWLPCLILVLTHVVAVTTCANGKDAIQTLRDRHSHCDLVLSDVYMPGAIPAKSTIVAWSSA